VALTCPRLMAAQTPPSSIEVTDAWIRPASKSSVATLAFFELINHTHDPESLMSVASPAGEGQLSLLRWHGSEYSIEEPSTIPIPPSSRLVLRPGEYFVILRETAQML